MDTTTVSIRLLWNSILIIFIKKPTWFFSLSINFNTWFHIAFNFSITWDFALLKAQVWWFVDTYILVILIEILNLVNFTKIILVNTNFNFCWNALRINQEESYRTFWGRNIISIICRDTMTRFWFSISLTVRWSQRLTYKYSVNKRIL